ncbi:hypothetical protein FDP41_006002 [Naegleria fowleri]|uniref:Rab5-interacting protein n=1 Tax=Naegleria fowleri TaxID=5763 RepID=A0A6A5BMN9_NAEFO|nr:uncharacterized protein FDP41_006002 [Naegleria fowleri]KAF0975250.1 hypothetical protein FDP41_006002 [Naegleria fowleri]CAG4708897.1 unnamed protein product [Naegleria fowleri]
MSLGKLLNRSSEWNNKEEVLKTIYWIKQIYAIISGLVFGIVPILGFVGFASFGVSVALISYSVAYTVMRVSQNVIDSPSTVITEGMFPALTLFILTWTCTYSYLHA